MVKNSITSLMVLLLCFLLLVCGCTTQTNNNDGTIITNSTPSGADVYLNNMYNGTTPNTINSVPPGDYQIELRLNNYQNYSESINLTSNEVYKFSVSLIPITPTPLPAQTTMANPLPAINNGGNAPLTITVQRNGDYSSRDVIHFSGTGPIGQSVTIMISESNGPGYVAYKVAKVNDDGSWSYNFDLKTIPIALGQSTAKAAILSSNIESSPVKINITS
jgi:PEGA domain